MSSTSSSTSWSDCLNNPFCTGDNGIAPIVIHIIILFITIFLVYILRSDRMFVGLLILWDFNLWVFAFVTSVEFWYALIAFDLWAMNKYLDTKKNNDADTEAAGIDDENQENFMPGIAADSKHHQVETNDDEDEETGSSENDVEKADPLRRESMVANDPY